ncbi:MAG: hypothetical protein ACTSXX_06420 [Candidatus Baldrarchaeia archaeon]
MTQKVAPSPKPENFYVVPIKIRLYGLCGIEKVPRSGAVRRTIRFIPGSTLLGAITNVYLNYLCDSDKKCAKGIDCPSKNDCLLYQLFESLRQNQLYIFHAVPLPANTFDHTNPFKSYFTACKMLELVIRTKIVPHLGINRLSKTVQLVKEEEPTEEFRGFLYGDEVFELTSRSFLTLALIEENLTDELIKIFNLLNIARIGFRSKYCFLDADLCTKYKINAKDAISTFLKEFQNASGSNFVACCGIAIMDGEDPREILSRCFNVSLSIVRIDKDREGKSIRVYDRSGKPMFSIYDILKNSNHKTKPKFVAVSNLNVELHLESINATTEELILFGYPNLKLNVFGWNKLLPKHVYERIGDRLETT